VTPFLAASLAATAATLLLAVLLRGAAYAAFVGVLLSIHTLVLVGLQHVFEPLLPLVIWLQLATLIHLLMLINARLRPNWYRAVVSIPAHFWIAGTFLAAPWAIASAVGLPLFGWWLPYIAALLGVAQSLRSRPEVVDLVLDGEHHPKLRRLSARRHRGGGQVTGTSQPLRIVQITDPHLGPFMSEERLRGICERAVAEEPELVLLTGDFFTMEGRGSADSLARALSPLESLTGRTFACLGNHDLEAPRAVAEGLAAAGVQLLIDQHAEIETSSGPVQIVGLNHIWRKRAERYGAVFARTPAPGDALRLVLLHDPSGFAHLPMGQADLVLSGHTHGGHVGLISLGLDWTSIGGLFGMPDHGFWGRGPDRMYIHRANGHYGFPLRVGVPSEESVLRVTLK
jgi:uncharacterized protein